MSLTVLVIDDVPTNVNLLGLGLKARGFEHIPAFSAEEGIQAAREQQPDVIILDYHMPGMDGLEACKILLEDPRTLDMPIIMLTADDRPETLQAVLAAGAKDFLSKPFCMDLLEPRIRRAVDEQRAQKEVKRLNREIARDLQHALRIQSALLPQSGQTHPRLHMSWRYEPCMSIGGDGLGMEIADDFAVFYIFDVSGHGIAAALQSVMITCCLRELIGKGLDATWYSPQTGANPAALVSYLNSRFRFNHSTSFFSILVCILDLKTGILRYCNAGHPGLIHAQAGQSKSIAFEPQAVAGVFAADYVYHGEELQLQSGDRLILYTDGIEESRNADGEQLTLSRMLEFLDAEAAGELETDIERLWQGAMTWRDADLAQDDAAVLGISFT